MANTSIEYEGKTVNISDTNNLIKENIRSMLTLDTSPPIQLNRASIISENVKPKIMTMLQDINPTMKSEECISYSSSVCDSLKVLSNDIKIEDYTDLKNISVSPSNINGHINNSENVVHENSNILIKKTVLINNSSIENEPVKKRIALSPISGRESKKFCSESKINMLDETSIMVSDSIQTKVKKPIQMDNESISDLNDIYKGLLSESIDNFPKPDVTRQKLKRLKRKELEDIILEQLVTTLLSDCHLGYQKDLCTRLEQNLTHAHKKIRQLNQEVKDLTKVTNKLAEEHVSRGLEHMTPVIIKRSVGIQAEPQYIDQDFEDEFYGNEVTLLSAQTSHKKNVNTKKGVRKKLKNVHQTDIDDSENLSDMDDRCCYESSIDHSDNDEREEIYKQKILEYNNSKYRNGTIKSKLPRPTLNAKQKNCSIILTWNTPESTCQNIASFRLYSCQNEKANGKKNWKIIGDVEPMALPMACTLTDFHLKQTYHFSVRAINFKGENGPLSRPSTVLMS